MEQKTAIIIGAGPAGLTVALELLRRTDIHPIVLEKSEYMGGISRTVNYKGNRIDIGGHRFFSKSDRVMQWWLNILPLQKTNKAEEQIKYQSQSSKVQSSEASPDPEKTDEVMLLRERKSRIYFLRKFFDYPIGLSINTLLNLGPFKTVRIGLSYFKSVIAPIKSESNLEQFFINRFGKELYRMFFKSYTEKVWGVPCHEISAEWGAQRIKGLSVAKTLRHILAKPFRKKSDVSQKNIETSLIEQFLYPKYGPGQMWEEVAKKVLEGGGEILTDFEINQVHLNCTRVEAVEGVAKKGTFRSFKGDYFFSTMPISDLVNAMGKSVPADIKELSEGLVYRDFLTVGLLLKQLKIKDQEGKSNLIKDNWIYIQEPDVLVGRMQIFNNWSPYMVNEPSNAWVGLEYFCNKGDEIWTMSDEQMIQLAIEELSKIKIIDVADVLDATVIRMEKTYPAYFGSYDRFPVLQKYLNSFQNLFLIGRNGMHKYNNQDHSMLTGMVAVDNIIAGRTDKTNIWSVNTESDYHEEK